DRSPRRVRTAPPPGGHRPACGRSRPVARTPPDRGATGRDIARTLPWRVADHLLVRTGFPVPGAVRDLAVGCVPGPPAPAQAGRPTLQKKVDWIGDAARGPWRLLRPRSPGVRTDSTRAGFAARPATSAIGRRSHPSGSWLAGTARDQNRSPAVIDSPS